MGQLRAWGKYAAPRLLAWQMQLASIVFVSARVPSWNMMARRDLPHPLCCQVQRVLVFIVVAVLFTAGSHLVHLCLSAAILIRF